MKSKELKAILENLETLKCTTFGSLDTPSEENLAEIIVQTKTLISEAERQEHQEAVVSFKQYMEKLLTSTADNEEELDKFSNLPVSITYGDRTLALENCACVFDYITDMLDEYLKDM